MIMSVCIFLTFSDMCGSLIFIPHQLRLSLVPYRMAVIIAVWVTDAFVQTTFLKWTVEALAPRNATIISQGSYTVIFGLDPL